MDGYHRALLRFDFYFVRYITGYSKVHLPPAAIAGVDD